MADKDADKKPAAKKEPAKKGPANLEERMEGIQGWMAEIEKKLERTSRIGAVAVGVAILAAAGALALGIMNKQDGATKDDIDELTQQVNELGASVEKQTETQVQSINQRLAQVEQQIRGVNQRQRQTESQIDQLRTQVNQAQAAASAAESAAAANADSGGSGGNP